MFSMLLKKPNLPRIIIGLILIMSICVLSASGNENRTSDAIAENLTRGPSITPINYFITIDPISDHTIGEIFFINGTTNLPLFENISMSFIESRSLGRNSIKEPGRSPYDYEIENIPISPAKSGINRWSVNMTEFAVNNLKNTQYFFDVGNSYASSSGELILFPTNSNKLIQNSSLTQSVLETRHPATNTETIPPSTPPSSMAFFLPIIPIAMILILRFVRSKKSD